MLRGLGNVAKLMGSMGEIQSRMEAMKESLAELKVEGSAGGGMVRVEATGNHRITRITIEQTLMDAGDREMIEELVARGDESGSRQGETSRRRSDEQHGRRSGDSRHR